MVPVTGTNPKKLHRRRGLDLTSYCQIDKKKVMLGAGEEAAAAAARTGGG